MSYQLKIMDTGGSEKMINDMIWWQKEIIYQVYPHSFYDDNEDGIGDLRGIIKKLDYLEWLGVKAIWISPIYPSPMADFGYDISDYKGINPLYGNLHDFSELIGKIHEKKMKLILDLVPNHTSADHEWFYESQSSKDNPKRDWYIWKEPREDGTSPNNWLSEFGGSAWEFDENTGQYYYHTFLKEQPDLNWYNPEVREAIWDVMRYWLKKGVDGFRVDVLWYLIKDLHFRDNPPNPEWQEGMPEHDKLIPAFSNDQPEVHEVVAEMRQVMDEFPETLLIGEIYLPVHKLVAYYGEENGGVHLPFNFHLLLIKWDAPEINNLIASYEGALPDQSWPNWVMGNHDNKRIKTKIGTNQVWNAALLLLTLRGTPTMYYGDEIGMENIHIPQHKVHDPREINEPGIGVGRDPERTPMQWTGEKNAGFSSVEPWLPVGENKDEVNVERQRKDPDSLLSFYHRLIILRQKEPALYGGDYFPAGLKDQLLCYTRKHKEDEFLIMLNLGEEKISFKTDFSWTGRIEIARNREKEGKEIKDGASLKGGEGYVIRINSRG